jgi:hypothetical protein
MGQIKKCLAYLGVVPRGYRPDRRQIPNLHREMQLRNRRTGWIDIYYRMGEGKYRFGRSVPGPTSAAREMARTSLRQCDA